MPSLETFSRIQFALTAGFHIAFSAVTVGLSLFLLLMYTRYRQTGNEMYNKIYHFWLNIFAVGFGIGVVMGVVMTFEFGLNWGRYAEAVGPILGVIIGMEVVTAFFLEAGFLGIMLYGEGRVSPRVMHFAVAMVALGSFLSASWILSANSWMQTPAGYRVVNGQFQAVDWKAIIFNPSFVWRYPHMLMATLLAAGFAIAGTGAWYLLKQRHLPFARQTFSLGLGLICIFMPIQLFLGDSVAKFMGPTQPAKGEAIEGNWDSGNTGYNLIIWPDQQDQKNIIQISLPGGASILRGDFTFHSGFPGLKLTKPDRQPSMLFVFYGFRLMFYLAILMFAMAAWSLVLRLRGRLFTARWFHRVMVLLLPAGILAVIGGWITAETGRQPYVVYGQLLTADAVSPLNPWVVVLSVTAFVLVYVTLYTLYVRMFIRQLRAGPDQMATIAPPLGTPTASDMEAELVLEGGHK